ncbi:S9 family peptidase [uncultured Microbulbifer sp.]|uniref:alpha/beta hydrolase family protein n=1 Tax=uncultured Microbulbifer sp. TaxID=348147 RepID=UPI002634E3C2|nr:S9 family peptidase [uncultured Microbulbifer sp.]
MKIKSLLGFAVLAAGLAGATACSGPTAQPQVSDEQAKPFASLGEMPVPFEDLFRPLAYSNIRISPDGRHLAAGKVRDNGLMDAVIIDRRTMEITSSLEMAGNMGVADIRWANNERVLFSFSRKSALAEGAGNFSIAGMNVDGSRKDVIWRGSNDYGGNESAMLSGKIDDEHFRVVVYPSGSSTNFPLNYIYKLNIYTGKSTRIARSPIRLSQPIFKKGEITHWVGRLANSFDHTVVATREDDGGWEETVYDNSKGVFAPVAWTNEDDWMWYSDTIEAPTKGLYKVNVKTGEKKLVYRHPKVDYSQTYSDDDGNPWGALVNYDYPEVVYLDEDNHYAKTHKQLQGTFPNSAIQIVNRTADGNEWVVHVASDRHPGTYYLYNQFDGAMKELANRAQWIDPAKMPATHPIRFNARDGLEINGYITLPVSKEAKDLPLIVLPHGGPHGPRDYWTYDRESIRFANAGYAVMHVNYRGSGGYGREFLFGGYGKWGREMQDDLTDATYWAIQSGIADRERICIYGASYGGYAAMMGITKESDLYKCGIGYVGVYDLNIFMTEGDIPLREAGRTYLKAAVGTDPKERARRSPAANTDRIQAPVFLIQGKRDVRVHWAHYEAMRDALVAQDHALETLVAPRAAHGAREEDSQLEIYCRMIDFFDRHIGDGKPTDAPADDCVPAGALGLEYKYYEGVKRG